MKEPLRLGTRQSVLALTQSRQVAARLESLHPGLQVKLVGITTEGDRITDRPLQQMEGKDFFVKEIDRALLANEIDFAVHSLKDLSTSRPEEIRLAAIPPREFPADIIIFSPDILEKLAAGVEIKIGTSSPRRLENVSQFLRDALPKFPENKPWTLSFVEIRGNVTTRLERVHGSSAKNPGLDGVVLAYAGLNRLFKDTDSRPILEKRLQGCRKMVLPLSLCPSAAGQGALAVECRADDAVVARVLAALDCAKTRRLVSWERDIFSSYGGGCHQRFGATALAPEGGEAVMFLKGKSLDGVEIADHLYELNDGPLESPTEFWDGSTLRPTSIPLSPNLDAALTPGAACFASHAKALAEISSSTRDRLNTCRVWTAGVKTWLSLARQGVFVEGSADSLGFRTLMTSVHEDFMGLPSEKNWIMITHETAAKRWRDCRTLATYRSETDRSDPMMIERLRHARAVYWHSGEQVVELFRFAGPKATHASGFGETRTRLREAGCHEARSFFSAEDWRRWLKL